MEVGTLALLLEQLVHLREAIEAGDRRRERLKEDCLEALSEVHERIDLTLNTVHKVQRELQQAFLSLTLLQQRLRILEDNCVFEETHVGFFDQLD